MCDLTQFVVVVPVPGMTASIIAKYFMQEVLLKFGIGHLVVIYDDVPFKGICIAACDSLHLKYESVSTHNHKVVLIEKLHCFLNELLPLLLVIGRY